MERKHPLAKLDFQFQQVDDTPEEIAVTASTSTIPENIDKTNEDQDKNSNGDNRPNPLAMTQTRVESFLKKKLGITAQKKLTTI